MSFWTKEFLQEFIRIYKEEECLWKVKSDLYYDKHKRDLSYDKLLRKIQEIHPHAQRDAVVKKIKNLRTVFLREYKQVKDSRSSGADLDSVYVPRLWYYKDLEFLADQDEDSVSSHSQDAIVAKVEKDQEESPHAYTITLNTARAGDSESPTDDESPVSCPSAITRPNATPGSNPYISRTGERPHQRRPVVAGRPTPREPCGRGIKRKAPSEDETTPMLTREKLTDMIPKSDKFDTFGQHVAKCLREMSKEQYVHAQKVISDAIYEGQLGNLSRNSCLLTNVDELHSTIPYSAFQKYRATFGNDIDKV